MANPEGKLVLFIVTFYKRPVKNNHKENGNIYVWNYWGYDYALTVDKTWIKTRRESKEGCIGVNLNRNFNNDFEQGSGPCSDNDYPGEESNSEPETLAISETELY